MKIENGGYDIFKSHHNLHNPVYYYYRVEEATKLQVNALKNTFKKHLSVVS